MAKISGYVKKNREIAAILTAIIFANLLFLNEKNWLMNPVYIAFAAILFYIGIKQIYRYREKLLRPRIWQGLVFLGLLFSMMVVAGAKIQPGDSIVTGSRVFEALNILDAFWLVFYAIIGIGLFSNLYLLTENKKVRASVCVQETQREKVDIRRWALYSLILAASWIPVFISYYPGIVPEDATWSVGMVMGDVPWDNHFPVFYSVIVGVFVKLGVALNNINIGIALYSFFQLLVMASGMGFFLAWLQKKGQGKVYLYFSLAYFCAAPLFGNYAIVMWKDPIFSGLLIMLAIFLYENVAETRAAFLEKKNLVLYALLLVFMCLMRNNGIYIAFLINLCLAVIYRKHLKRIILTLAGSLALVYLITGPLYMQLFKAENLFVESVGIPLQQMARTVVTKGTMTETDKEFMNQLLPLEQYDEYYDPFLVDPVKWAGDFDTEFLNAHKKEFFQTWLSMLTKNFGTYVEQYLMGTYGYWHIGRDVNYELAKLHVAENPWYIYESSPIETYLGYQIKDTLSTKYDYIESGLVIWLMLVNVVLCWMKKKSIYIIPLLVMVGTWLTLMVATPTAFGVRYIFVFVLGLPLLLSYQWMINKE